MNKKVGIIILILAILLILISVVMFTNIGQEMREYLYYKITTPKEMVSFEKPEEIKITYTYRWQDENFDIVVADSELINMIQDSISNKKLDNYSSQILLSVLGEYNVDLDNGVSFKFDSYDDDGYVMLDNNGKQFLTKINPEILKQVVEIVDEELTKRTMIFDTDKVTISQGDMVTEITEKTALEYILNQCKGIYTKEINYEPTIETPDYEIDFNNGIKLYIYNQNEQGWFLKDGKLSEAYQLSSFDTILKNAFNKIDQKREMFTADKITIIDPNKSIEITDKEIIEKITTPLIYSNLSTPEWLKDYNINEEYDKGIKVKINDYEYLIPGKVGNVTIGNRYAISKDKEISLCYPLISIDNYVNELLGNKMEETTGTTIIAVPEE